MYECHSASAEALGRATACSEYAPVAPSAPQCKGRVRLFDPNNEPLNSSTNDPCAKFAVNPTQIGTMEEDRRAQLADTCAAHACIPAAASESAVSLPVALTTTPRACGSHLCWDRRRHSTVLHHYGITEFSTRLLWDSMRRDGFQQRMNLSLCDFTATARCNTLLLGGLAAALLPLLSGMLSSHLPSSTCALLPACDC